MEWVGIYYVDCCVLSIRHNNVPS